VRDLGDAQELIRVLKLSDDFAHRLNPFVRNEFLKLAQGLRSLDESG